MKTISEEIIKEHELAKTQHNGWVCAETRKRAYGLPQVGTLSNDLLKERLKVAGCYPTSATPGLRRHYS